MEFDDIDNIDKDNSNDDLDNFNDNLDDDLNFNDGLDMDNGGIPPMEKHSELLKQLMSFNKYLAEKYNGWLGISWNEATERYEKNVLLQPIMNERGASWSISFLNTYARDNNMITNISKEEYEDFQEDLINTIFFNIGTRMEEFGIKSDGDRVRICDELFHTALLVLMGSGDGKASKILTESTSRNESVMVNPNQAPLPYPQARQQGFLSNVKKIFAGR